MYCPRCSQQQVSEETKFCSRCGFPLGLVSEILAHGGFLPQLAEIYKSRKIFTRRNGVIFSLFWFLIFVLVFTPLIAITDGPEGLVAATALIGTMGSLITLIASLLLLKKEPSNSTILYNQQLSNQSEKNFIQTPAANQSALPPQREQNYVPPVNTWKARDTGDFAPRSVTEGTTKLLQKDDQ